MKNYEEALTGGHPNSLGNTVEVVEAVLADTGSFEELFNCYFSDDEVVRLRTSNAMKRICKVNKALLLPYIDSFLDDIARIDQASTQWTLAQLFDALESDLTAAQKEKAKAIMKINLENHQDWIVLNMTMATLTKWAKNDEGLRTWIVPHLERLTTDSRKSVAKGAAKMLGQLAP